MSRAKHSRTAIAYLLQYILSIIAKHLLSLTHIHRVNVSMAQHELLSTDFYFEITMKLIKLPKSISYHVSLPKQNNVKLEATYLVRQSHSNHIVIQKHFVQMSAAMAIYKSIGQRLFVKQNWRIIAICPRFDSKLQYQFFSFEFRRAKRSSVGIQRFFRPTVNPNQNSVYFLLKSTAEYSAISSVP